MEKSLIIRLALWNEEAAALLMQSAHDPLVGLGTLKGIVKSERGALYEVHCDGLLVGAYVIEVRQAEFGTIAQMVAAGASMPGANLTEAIIPFIEKQYSFCDRITIIASRRGMARKLQKLSFKQRAAIFDKELR